MEAETDQKSTLLIQYEQIRQDFREYNKSVWQTPSLAFAVESLIITLALQHEKYNVYTRTGILTIGTFLVLGLTITFLKHSIFQGLKAQCAADLAKMLGMKEEPYPFVEKSKELEKRSKSFFKNKILKGAIDISAVDFLATILFFIIYANIVLLFFIGFGVL